MTAAILSLRFRGPVVPLVAGVYAFGSHTLFWAYPVSTELFLVVTMGLAVLGLLWGLERQHLLATIGGAAVAGFLVTEKATLLVAIGPLLLLVLLRLPGARQRAPVIGAAVAVFAIGSMPYLYYSDGTSYNAYAGCTWWCSPTTTSGVRSRSAQQQRWWCRSPSSRTTTAGRATRSGGSPTRAQSSGSCRSRPRRRLPTSYAATSDE
ncbi:MAG: hypothetical protein JJE52_00115 [Acidimicrobiia bacterium]|nr:hypothetical protein [Acidimicrobiia bacterium]